MSARKYAKRFNGEDYEDDEDDYEDDEEDEDEDDDTPLIKKFATEYIEALEDEDDVIQEAVGEGWEFDKAPFEQIACKALPKTVRLKVVSDKDATKVLGTVIINNKYDKNGYPLPIGKAKFIKSGGWTEKVKPILLKIRRSSWRFDDD